MKRVQNANKTTSHVMRQEPPEYESSDISGKHVMFSHHTGGEQYVLHRKANVPETAGPNLPPRGRCAVIRHLHRSVIFDTSGKNAARPWKLTLEGSEDGETDQAVGTREFRHNPRLFDFSAVCQNKASPSWQPGTRPRKTQQQLQKENHSATTIQSAWRGYQVRREMDGRNKAAAKIQAAFRGYRTRRDLPLGFNTCDTDAGLQLKKRWQAKGKPKLFPVILGFYQLWDWDTGTPSPIAQSSSFRSCHKPTNREGSLFFPTVIFPKAESSLKTSRKGFVVPAGFPTCTAFESKTQLRRMSQAAVLIQAAWRGYRSRKQLWEVKRQAKVKAKESQLLPNGYKNSPESCERLLPSGAAAAAEIPSSPTEQKAPVQDPAVTETPSKASQSTSTEGSVPAVRNINLHLFVKGVPAARRLPVAIRVSSPNAIVQGYHRDMSRGMQGLYTVKNQHDPRPSRIIIQITMAEKEGTPASPP